LSKGVLRVFSEVAHLYELVNHVLTLGLDIPWRKRAAEMAASGGGTLWLDVCGGTGEMAADLMNLAANDTRIIVSDFSIPMISRAVKKGKLSKATFSLADSQQLPFPDNTFDLIVISFATRNITPTCEKLTKFLREFHRILKPGGRFVNLETSQPSSMPIRIAFHLYTKQVVKLVGKMISGSKTGYAYLAHTISRFFNAEALSDMLYESGFSNVKYVEMTFGTVAIHRAVK
jgi:demethylmenaquinone methyltransferase/2-methoxy-6-polyprenyl-1,4-benzoquinol methylase